MSKTWHAVCKPAQAEATFSAVDTDKNGYLNGNDIRLLLIRMGNPIAASNDFDSVLADMKAKDIYGGKTCGAFRAMLPKCCGGIRLDKSWVARDSVSPHEFQDWCRANQHRATVGTYVFAVQTFALVTAKTSDFSILELFNMDIGKAVKTCRMPNCGLFCGIMGMGVVPFFAGLSMYCGIWFLATQVGKDIVSQALVEAKQALDSDQVDKAEAALEILDSGRYVVDRDRKEMRGLPLGWHHLQRGFIQLFLFTFAPVTRKCAEMLICREVTNDGVAELRLVSNLQLACWRGEHLVATVICSIVLFIYVVVVPSQFLKQTQRYMAKRDRQREVDEVDTSWLVGVDSGCSICKPSQFLSARRLDATLRPELLARMKSVPTLNPKCWDELFKATRPEKYW